MTFSEKYLDLCARNKEKPTALAEKLGFSRATGTKWSNGGSANKTAKRAIAAYFNVPLEYLDDDEKPAPSEGDGLDSQLLKKLMLLTPEERTKVDAFVQGLLAARSEAVSLHK